jgi:AraC family transcriptional regulator
MRLVGSDDGLGAAFEWLYGQWLPTSGAEPRDFPPYAQRVKFFPDVPEAESVTDLFLPIH